MTGTYILVLALVLVTVPSFYQAVSAKAILPVPTECSQYNSLNYTVHLAHENDCTKFYKCDRGERYEFQCPLFGEAQNKRLYFNRVHQVCDWPRKELCDNYNPSYGEKRAIAGQCDKYEVYTSNGWQVERCSEGKLFYPTEKECTWANRVDTISKKRHDWDCRSYLECSKCSGKCVHHQCRYGDYYDEHSGRCALNTTVNCKTDCPREGSPDFGKEIHLPHDCQCDLYFKCQGSKKRAVKCPEGLYFDGDSRRCLAEAICEKRNERSTTPRTTTSTTPSTTTSTTPRTTTSTTPSTTTSTTPSTTTSTTPSTTTSTTPSTTTSTTPSTTTSTTPSTTTSTTTPKPSFESDCPAYGTPLVPHECYCDQYYQCINKNEKEPRQCPGSENFDYKRKECTDSEDVNCYKKPSNYNC